MVGIGDVYEILRGHGAGYRPWRDEVCVNVNSIRFHGHLHRSTDIVNRSKDSQLDLRHQGEVVLVRPRRRFARPELPALARPMVLTPRPRNIRTFISTSAEGGRRFSGASSNRRRVSRQPG